MRLQKLNTYYGIIFFGLLAIASVATKTILASPACENFPQQPAAIEFITADELKAKLAKNEPITIIDVRSVSGLANGDNKIKGAIYVKLRRLKYRLGFSPLKDVPRSGQVVTYCACPNDESSIKAAQILREAGFKNARVLKGGWVVWKKANGQVEPMGRGI
jgi:rhodanese-related sulfurtransferase